MEYEVQKHLHYAGIPSFNLYPVTRELKDDVDITIMEMCIRDSSWESTCLASRGSRVRISLSPRNRDKTVSIQKTESGEAFR